MTSIKTPRSHGLQIKSLQTWEELNRWATDIDQAVVDLIASIKDVATLIDRLTNKTTPAAPLPLIYANATNGASASVTLSVTSGSTVLLLGFIDWAATAVGPTPVPVAISEASAGTLEAGTASASTVSNPAGTVALVATHGGISGSKTYTISASGVTIARAKIVAVEFRVAST